MRKLDRFCMILIGFLIGIIFFSNPVVTEEVIVEKEVPVEVAVEKEAVKEVPTPQKQIGKKYKEGTYKVGRDIPAGEYKAESNGKDVTNSIRVSIGENPNFDVYDEYNFTLYHNVALFVVKDGEYVKVDDADFWLIE